VGRIWVRLLLSGSLYWKLLQHDVMRVFLMHVLLKCTKTELKKDFADMIRFIKTKPA